MRKEDFVSFVVYLVIIALGVVAGCTVLSNALSAITFMKPFWFAIIVIGFALLINVTGLELLHALGAKAGGYEVDSINILGLCFEKKNNQWSTSFKNFDGLTGETKIAPAKDKTSLKQYVWFPLLGYLLQLVLFISIYLILENSGKAPWLKAVALIFVIISSMLGIYNIVPLKLDSQNDGYKFTLINKQINVDGFNELARVEHLERNGLEVKEIKTFDQQGEYTSKVNLKAANYFIANKDYESAKKLLENLILEENKISDDIKFRALAQKMYITLLTEDLNNAREFYDSAFKDKVRRFIANDSEISSLRAYLLVAGLLDDSESEVKLILKKLEKVRKNSSKTVVDIEEKLFNEGIDIIVSKHNDWEIKDIA